jgi:hypothetical protein
VARRDAASELLNAPHGHTCTVLTNGEHRVVLHTDDGDIERVAPTFAAAVLAALDAYAAKFGQLELL